MHGRVQDSISTSIVRLIDAQTVQITPIGAGNRQTLYSEDAAKHGLQTDVNKMPDPVELDKYGSSD